MGAGTVKDYPRLNETLRPAELQVSWKVLEILVDFGVPDDILLAEARDPSEAALADISTMLTIVADAKSSVSATSYGTYMRKRAAALSRATS
eukprot:1325800-Amphidinium_carterae.1